MNNEKKSSAGKGLGSYLIVLLLITVGIAAFLILKNLRQAPQKTVRNFPGPLVVTKPMTPIDVRMNVQGFGTVQAKVKVQLIPEVSGCVVQIHPQLVKGGFFKKNEPLIQIDSRDFELAVRQSQADVAAAQVKLEQEQAEADVAGYEWQQLHPDEPPASPLVLRMPQIHQAQAELAGAQAKLEEARLDLERTTLTLPFDGRVIEKTVDRGQYVGSGKTIASVYGTDVVEIPVPLEDHELAWFDVPGENGNNGHSGAQAIVTTRFAGANCQWRGRVVRTEGRIDETSRMVHVIVEINHPFDLAQQAQPLLPGMFVEVQILGHTLSNVFAVDNHAIRNGHQVWIVENNKLCIRDVKIARQTRQITYVSSGLGRNAIVITGPLDSVTDGMKVRVQSAANNQHSVVSEKESL